MANRRPTLQRILGFLLGELAVSDFLEDLRFCLGRSHLGVSEVSNFQEDWRPTLQMIWRFLLSELEVSDFPKDWRSYLGGFYLGRSHLEGLKFNYPQTIVKLPHTLFGTSS